MRAASLTQGRPPSFPQTVRGKAGPEPLAGPGSCGRERPVLPGSGPGRHEEPLTERVLLLVTTETTSGFDREARQGSPGTGPSEARELGDPASRRGRCPTPAGSGTWILA